MHCTHSNLFGRKKIRIQAFFSESLSVRTFSCSSLWSARDSSVCRLHKVLFSHTNNIDIINDISPLHRCIIDESNTVDSTHIAYFCFFACLLCRTSTKGNPSHKWTGTCIVDRLCLVPWKLTNKRKEKICSNITFVIQEIRNKNVNIVRRLKL